MSDTCVVLFFGVREREDRVSTVGKGGVNFMTRGRSLAMGEWAPRAQVREVSLFQAPKKKWLTLAAASSNNTHTSSQPRQERRSGEGVRGDVKKRNERVKRHQRFETKEREEYDLWRDRVRNGE